MNSSIPKRSNPFTVFVVLFLLSGLFCQCGNSNRPSPEHQPTPTQIANGWKAMAGNIPGHVIYAVPPDMFFIDLQTGTRKKIPGIRTAGAPGRRNRGKSPRPSLSPDGQHFVFRFDGNIYASGINGKPLLTIVNDQMDRSDETRWTWFRSPSTQKDWAAGPAKNGDMILVDILNPQITRTAYSGGNIEKHCEITGNGKYIVYDNGSDIYVTTFGSTKPGFKISSGQSCRPCAAPNNYAAWLPNPHTRYVIFNTENGKPASDLKAPPNEEIYRLNWSNHPNYAIHMYGSRGNTKIHVRKLNTNQYLYIANGWDPDLWVEKD